jgi:hypothetical protein
LEVVSLADWELGGTSSVTPRPRRERRAASTFPSLFRRYTPLVHLANRLALCCVARQGLASIIIIIIVIATASRTTSAFSFPTTTTLLLLAPFSAPASFTSELRLDYY